MQTQQVGGKRSRVARALQARNQKSPSPTPAKKKCLVDAGMPKFSAAMDALEKRTGIPFEVWIKQPRPQRFDAKGRRPVQVLTPESLARGKAAPASFAEFSKEWSVWPIGILVEPQPGEAVNFKLVNLTGRIVGQCSICREVYEFITDAVAASGTSFMEFAINAIAEKIDRQKGGAR